MSQIDWNAVVFNSDDGLYNKLEKIAHRRFPNDAGLAEEAFNVALDAVSADQWACLRHYRGDVAEQAFLITVFRNQLEDFYRERFGRLRPPAGISRKGGVWLDVYQRLIIEQRPMQSVVDQIVDATNWSESEVTEVVRQVKAQINMRAPRSRPLAPDCDPEPILISTAGDDTPEQQVRKQTLEQTLFSLASLLFGKRQTTEGNWPTIDDEDRVLLRLHYVEGLPIAACARMLGRKDHDVRRHHHKLLKQLKRFMTDADDFDVLD